MIFQINLTDKAKAQISALKKDKGLLKRFKAVREALKKLQLDSRHPGLQTHEFHSLKGPDNEKVFEAYAEQKTSAAYRIFFYYGPEKGTITVFSVERHP